MPFVHLTTPTGPLDMHYNIITPISYSSPTIAAKLPCILFLHAGYMGQEVFEAQFCDPQLRKHFNLIAIDMRAWGLTSGSVGTDSYSPTDSADDVCRFKALSLPPLHVFGLSIGGCVALEMATTLPDMILSLTWCSPLPATEPEDIAAGRQEVWECWMKAYDHSGNNPSASLSDKDLLDDGIRGAQELCFNNQSNSLTEAITRNAMIQASLSRAGTPEKLANSYATSVSWFINRRPLSRRALSKQIKCPIRLIHCSDDIAYPLQHARGVEARLRDAGITDVVLHQVPGPHYGHLTNPQMMNPILHDFVLSVSCNGDASTSRHLPPSLNYQQHNDYPKVETPFTKQLEKYGYDPEEKDIESDLSN
ncbi:alpha/beta-hydrolase [Tricholoma matsutake]|nr:alpha/beta-hydrolase [Tricholoma matsutake 945]